MDLPTTRSSSSGATTAKARLPGGGAATGVTSNLVTLLDLGPTMLDLAGVPITGELRAARAAGTLQLGKGEEYSRRTVERIRTRLQTAR